MSFQLSMSPSVIIGLFTVIYIQPCASTLSVTDIPREQCNQTSIINSLDNIEHVLQQKIDKESLSVGKVQSMLNDIANLKDGQTSINTNFKRFKESFDNEMKIIKEENENLKRQLSAYKSQVSAIEVMIEKQIAMDNDLKEFKYNISKTIADMKIELRYMSLTLLDVRKRNEEVNSKIPKMVNDSFSPVNQTIESFKSELIQMQSNQMKALDAQIEDLQLNTSKVITEIRTRVGFTAGLDGEKRFWYGPKLICPIVVYEVGGGYNRTTGVFTSPTEGEFVFFVGLVSYYTQSLYLDIKLNGVSKVRAGASQGSEAAASNLVFLHLKKGDRVWVERHDGTGYSSHAVPLLTFSGFKI